MHYAGIGSRKTPNDVLAFMQKIAKWLAERDYILRSGAAQGADTAFENGAGMKKEIFTANSPIHPLAFETVDKYHPMPSALSGYVRKLMARNAMQIYGANMDTPVGFVICWTPDGANGTTVPTTRQSGGTGQTIRIAAAAGIEVFNLQDPAIVARIRKKVN